MSNNVEKPPKPKKKPAVPTEVTAVTEPGKELTIVPTLQGEFVNFLKKYQVGGKTGQMCDTIAENIAEVGGALVFEDPNLLAKGLARWTEYIGPPMRKQLLEHWCAKKNIPVPAEAMETVGIMPKAESALKKKEKLDKRVSEGNLYRVDIDDSGTPKMRMIKDETEPGIPLAEARALLRDMATKEEPIVIYDEALQRHTPNFKSAFVKQNPLAAWATARSMDRAMADGEPIDPTDVFIDQQVKLLKLKETLGAGVPEPKDKGTIAEMIAGVASLQEMAKTGQVTGLPTWITNPVEFINTVKQVSGGGATGTAGWLNDPLQFLQVIKGITAEPKVDEGLKAQIAEQTRQIAEQNRVIGEMRDEQHRQQLAALENQINAQKAASDRQIADLAVKIDEARKPVVGHTEYDILYEVADKGLAAVQSELAGFRSLIGGLFSGTSISRAKTPEEKQERVERFRSRLAADQDVEELGRKLFFPESPGVT